MTGRYITRGGHFDVDAWNGAEVHERAHALGADYWDEYNRVVSRLSAEEVEILKTADDHRPLRVAFNDAYYKKTPEAMGALMSALRLAVTLLRGNDAL